MKKLLKGVLITLGVIAFLFVSLTVATVAKSKKGEVKETLKNTKMTKYEYSVGGGMRGGGSSTTVAAYDDKHAIISYATQGWHADNKHVTEYLVDKQILDDIEQIFRKNKMQRWDGKKFTRDFVADGESYSYSFRFGKSLSYRFSSQIYPSRYKKKLVLYDEVLKKYEAGRTKLPGLVFPEMEDDELGAYKQELKENGKVNVEISSYALGILECTFTNGTGKDVEIPNDYYELYDESGKKLIHTFTSQYGGYGRTLYENGVYDNLLNEEVWLEPGTYRLYVGEDKEYSCEFVIE